MEVNRNDYGIGKDHIRLMTNFHQLKMQWEANGEAQSDIKRVHVSSSWAGFYICQITEDAEILQKMLRYFSPSQYTEVTQRSALPHLIAGESQ